MHVPQLHLFYLLYGLHVVKCLEYKTQSNVTIPITNRSGAEGCLIDILTTQFPCDTFLLIATDDSDLNMFLKSIYLTHCYDIIIKTKETENWILKINIYIIWTENMNNFITVVTRLAKDAMWNPKSKFIIFLHYLHNDEITKIFKILLYYNVFDIIFIKQNDIQNIPYILTYFPFYSNNCGRNVSNIVNLGNCADLKKMVIFPNKLPNGLYNCTVIVAVSEDTPFILFKNNSEFQFLTDEFLGIEHEILKNIGHIEKFHIEFINVNPDLRHGTALPNRKLTGSLSYLQNKSADIAAGGFVLTKNRADILDYVWGHYYPFFHLYTSAQDKKVWKKIIQQFSNTLWLLVLFSYCFVVITVSITRNLTIGREDQCKIALLIFGYLCGNCNQRISKVLKLRRILIFWIWFSFFISNFYNTAYYSLITGRDEIPYGYSKEQYTKYYKPCISDDIRSFFKFTYNTTLPGKQSKECKYVENVLNSVANINNLYAIDSDYSYKVRQYKFIDNEGNQKIFVSWYSVNRLIMSIYFTRGFPLLEKFQRYFWYYFESGMVKQFFEDVYHKSQLKKVVIKKFKVIELSDMRIIFTIYLIGIVTSFMCFLFELHKPKI